MFNVSARQTVHPTELLAIYILHIISSFAGTFKKKLTEKHRF